jgi:ABC-type oligopeptide transport system substrate-binding subunit
MRITKAAILLCGLTAAAAGARAAEAEPPWRHAMTMHGEPRYGPGFAHFGYVEPSAPKGGTLTLSAGGSFDSLNPFIIKGVPAEGWELVVERLMKRSRDEPFTLYGRIAEAVQVAPDRSWVGFRLRPEARWHDGTPITADDVVFSHATLKDKGRSNHRLYYRQVARVEKRGEREVRFVFAPGDNRELPMILGLMPVLPKARLAGRDFEKTGLAPIMGSGPYRVETVEPGRSISYRRVADWWGRELPANRGHFNFDVVRYEYYRDATVALEAFRAGLVDLREEADPARWVDGYAGPALARGDVVKEEIPHGRPAGMLGLVFNGRRPLFADRRVRFALAHALDFDWINRAFLHGTFVRTRSYFENSELAAVGPPSEAERALLAPFAADLPSEILTDAYAPPGEGMGTREALRTARAILEAVGWTFTADGARTADGIPAAFEILLVDPRHERTALEYARRLKRLGVAARVRTVDSAQYQHRLNTYDFDMIVYWWDQSLSPGNEQAFYFGSSAAEQEGTRNYAGIRSPAANALIGHLTAAGTRQDLIAAARALDRVLQWGHHVVPLYHLPADRVAFWNRFGRPPVAPLYGYQIDTWWIDPERDRALARK